MDTIKYRGWDKKRKLMFQSDNPSLRVVKHVDGTLHGYVTTDKKGELREVEIMLFIGLQDANKKDIYENDIVKIRKTYIGDHCISPYNGIIYFENGSFNVTGEAMFDTLAVNNDYWEIIGNRCENQELLKGDEYEIYNNKARFS